ncbi:MAG: hypothetical protein AAGH15_06140 [Myxococcota bacterium]
MGFRDDQEQLRAKNEALGNALRDAERRLEQAERVADAHEAKDERDESELRELRREVERLRRKAGELPRRSPSPAALAVGAALVRVPLGGLFFGGLQPAPALDAPPAAPAEVAPPPPPAAPKPEAEPEPAAGPFDRARFLGIVTAADDHPSVEVGQGCVLDVPVGPGPPVASAATLRCGGTLVYDGEEALGTSMQSWSFALEPGGAPGGEGPTYRLEMTDSGMRTGTRAQLRVSTIQSYATAWREGEVAWRVKVALDDYSLPRPASAIPASERLEAPFAEALRMRAEVEAREGPVPFDEDECEVHVHGLLRRGGYDCRVRVRCGERLVYGSGTAGWNRCEASEDEPARPGRAADGGLTEEDGDPRMTLDLEGERLVVADRVDGELWSVTFDLEEHEGCDLDDGDFRGRVRALDGVSRPGLRLEEGELTLRADGARAEAEVSLDCIDGFGTISAGSAVLAGRFGPGFATFAGVGVVAGDHVIFELDRR